MRDVQSQLQGWRRRVAPDADALEAEQEVRILRPGPPRCLNRGLAMLMKYRDGTQGDDYLFDQPEDLHRAYVAGCMGLNPATPGDWPMATIERLLFIRQNDGLKAFHSELRRTVSRS